MMLAKKPLTDRTIKAVKPAPLGKRTLLWDAIVPGLALRVTDSGKRSFVLVTRYPGSMHPAPRRLGAYCAISLGQARTKARQWLEIIASGVDPGKREIERRQQTFQAIAANYFQRKAKVRLRSSRAASVRNCGTLRTVSAASAISSGCSSRYL